MEIQTVAYDKLLRDSRNILKYFWVPFWSEWLQGVSPAENLGSISDPIAVTRQYWFSTEHSASFSEYYRVVLWTDAEKAQLKSLIGPPTGQMPFFEWSILKQSASKALSTAQHHFLVYS